ncbi:flavin-containing monooxygenase [Streptomyces sp. NPDC127084]|uniref:flavin-containing monooxygenase n=1 Tax=Streptomyces sp. NPDC127084 TaxID=3347133 RepID=UPI0036535D26
MLEASDRAAGSWPRYYDSLALFSPARYSSLPGMPFDGDPGRYPHRDEVVTYLTSYAARLDADIRTGTRVEAVRPDAVGFSLDLQGGGQLSARAVVAASGTFGRPYRPAPPGLDRFTGTVLHAADYREPAPFAGQRIVVVGAGNSAMQIAAELATVAHVTLASRHPVKFARQHILGRDLHFWLKKTGVDTAPLGRYLRTPPPPPRTAPAPPPPPPPRAAGPPPPALPAGAPHRRELPTTLEDRKATWPDGTVEEIDSILLATGYRPDLPYLDGLDVLDAAGRPRHRDGASLTHPALAFVGLEWQRSLSSNSLRGVGRDAARAARRLAHRLGVG